MVNKYRNDENATHNLELQVTLYYIFDCSIELMDNIATAFVM